MIPLKINNTHLCKIFEPDLDITGWSEEKIQEYSIKHGMFPTEVTLTSETYSRDADRTADYELMSLVIVNRKSKPVFTWNMISATYVKNLMDFLNYKYDFKDAEGNIIPENAAVISITYQDYVGIRTINAYLGQTIDGTLEEYYESNVAKLYWRNFRIAFPER